jgi:hypothetical protein
LRRCESCVALARERVELLDAHGEPARADEARGVLEKLTRRFGASR